MCIYLRWNLLHMSNVNRGLVITLTCKGSLSQRAIGKLENPFFLCDCLLLPQLIQLKGLFLTGGSFRSRAKGNGVPKRSGGISTTVTANLRASPSRAQKKKLTARVKRAAESGGGGRDTSREARGLNGSLFAVVAIKRTAIICSSSVGRSGELAGGRAFSVRTRKHTDTGRLFPAKTVTAAFPLRVTQFCTLIIPNANLSKN